MQKKKKDFELKFKEACNKKSSSRVVWAYNGAKVVFLFKTSRKLNISEI